MPHESSATKFGLRPIAYGRRGMVATANMLGSVAGVRTLAKGGNAVDAVVAAAAALGVVEPYMSGLAGCGSLVLTRPGEAPRVLNFLGRVPAGIDLSRIRDGVPSVGYLAPAVPGNLAGWARVLADYGTMSLAQVLEPAIEYAERGVPFTPFDHFMFDDEMERLNEDAAANYCHGGQVPMVGSILTQRDLAKTLQEIARYGIGYLYDGPLGRSIHRLMRDRQGFLAESDLRTYPERLRWVDPIQTTYRGVTVYVPPPPTSAVQVLETLNVLELFDVGHMSHLGPDHIGVIAEVSRLARMDTARFVGDPEHVEVPVEKLLSSDHSTALHDEVERRMRRPGSGPGMRSFGDDRGKATTHLAAVDASGLAVNITQSLGRGFGCGIVVPGTGVCLNNVLHWGNVTPGHANAIAPGRVVEFPIAPLHLFRSGSFWGTLGTPGGHGILTTTGQILVHLLDFSLNLQDAIGAPRFRWADDIGDPLPARALRVESRIPKITREALEARGYMVELLGAWSLRVGGAQGVLVDSETGWLAGAADPRRNGYAVGLV